ncbi:MAG: type IV pili twitching motility protein PilT, partial [Lachnospiraceae bacterium]|nr:type IV pili twitching motility protein PilT [Lachnospiraceae bacterium]MBP3576854.1 type IV pili twitching motility protein PilT [Lachnospiraceae bacterium]
MEVLDYLKKAVEEGASDIFFLAGSPATAKIEGRIVRIGEERLLPNHTRELIGQIYEVAKRSTEYFEKTGDDDFSFAVPGIARF